MEGNNITADDLKKLVKEATKEAVADAFMRAGMDIKDPISLQKDLAFVRAARLARERMSAKAFLTIVAVAVTTGLGFLIAGLLESVNSGAK
jgi:hypothetical protein